LISFQRKLKRTDSTVKEYLTATADGKREDELYGRQRVKISHKFKPMGDPEVMATIGLVRFPSGGEL
jgi:hypothetical protein